ncbi:MAG: transporter substrate-binding domain-containing protein [Flavobacteriales bacterium]|nr:transporter substrate-binding domain-containing protein [Flavobacteriales bacterium]
MMGRSKLLSLIVFAFWLSQPMFSQRSSKDSLVEFKIEEPLRVGIESSEPFIITNANEPYSGLSIFLWEGIAEDLDLEFEYIEYEGLGPLLKAVENREVDISINPVTVTPERLKAMEFTQPFFITNLAIAVRKDDAGPVMRLIRNLFSWEFWTAISLLAFIILVFGFFAWIFERKHNEAEFGRDAKGLWDSFWWSAVTMTTVGYGDKSPKTIGGRVVGLIWMFTAIVIISGFTASIASSLTVGQLSLDISNLEDLKKAKVLSLNGSTSEGYLKSKNILSKPVSTADEALELVANGEADAFVYDEPLIRYKIAEERLQDEIVVAPARFLTQYYAYALPLGTPLKALNLTILSRIETLQWKTKLAEYELD